MDDLKYLNSLKHKETFTRQDLFQSFLENGFDLSYASFCKKIEAFVKEGKITHIGRNLYSLPSKVKITYKHEYSELALEVADLIDEKYPLVDFSIFELTQLNTFVNHQIAHNVIYISIERDVMDFIFDEIKEKYPGRVLINPTPAIYHQYWNDNIIILLKLTTEAPKGKSKKWHSRLEKILVDLFSEPLLPQAVSLSEYPNIYEDAFSHYNLDEKCLFRYARRRKSAEKITKFINKETNIKLNNRS